jgi:probable rRNA maturation factor
MIRVEVFNAHPHRRIRRAPVRRTVRRVVSAERRRSAAVTVVFIDGRRCARINRKFLGHRGSTDVISFPLDEGSLTEGEVYVNLDRARAQAREYGVPEANEIVRLVVHGTLHVLGYDDTTARLRLRMKRREDRYVEALAPRSSRVRTA